MTDTTEAQDEPAQTDVEDKPQAPINILGEGNTPSEQPDKPPDNPPAQTAPAEYADFQMPEGVTADAQAATQLKGIAKACGLSQAQAQKMADVGTGMMQRWQAAQAQAMQKSVADWAQAAHADAEYGGAKYSESLNTANAALSRFASPALRQLLSDAGLNQHPEVIRLFYRVGQQVSEDTVVGGTGGTGQAKAMEDVFYGNSEASQ